MKQLKPTKSYKRFAIKLIPNKVNKNKKMEMKENKYNA